MAVVESVLGPDVASVEVVTMSGIVVCLRHAGVGDGDEAAVLFCGGALGGLSGPMRVFERVAQRTGGVRIHYRRPGEMDDCVLDVLLLAHLLERTGSQRFVLVGHSFGGAVAIAAGVALGATCAGVVTLASQVPGAEEVAKLAGVPLLLIHGDRDAILPDSSSRWLYEEAGEPKDLVIVPGEGHLFEGVGDALTERVAGFVHAALEAG
jgi:pimeloyl-ACP methyl ester carboxylesterase